MPLRIFEPRYLTLVSDCLKSQSGFGICLIDQGEEVGSAARPYPYGTMVEIADWDQDESGMLLIVTHGLQKFRITKTTESPGGLLLGEVKLLPFEQSAPVPAELTDMSELLRRAAKSLGSAVNYSNSNYQDAMWVSSRLVELMPMSSEKRHELVAIADPVERLAAIANIIRSD